MLGEELLVVRALGDVFDELGVRWLVGGSVASSLHGEPRSTNDIDVVAELSTAQVAQLVARVSAGWYVDADTVADAVRRRTSFNLIHLDTMTKVDVFVARRRGREELARAVTIDVEGLRLPLAMAEDIVVEKLIWFEKGARVSQRQWRDLVGVLRTRGAELDLTWMRQEVAALGLGDLLEAALRDAEP